ncbi:iron ABC transporter substrate-binding protein [Truepera radiovictrix]|uniref:Extracellular solute-binding protein family 1 n=1 Tax=Truepera radiovictrix (strain DSM 17093 / CIP 108686 / LMG 22925 / RQ-24) TaxID=649638 RepID=D7CXQ1_TRURR|nr:iron ABC transporter substrate-binding protein [Truepera radiovictrix]ADI14653.1 extracellular solute-binding protein family 1 [Truepera radiovictrix DSM 17093]WMT56796.1 iron ABC transporter substrate-binding protein [Truepera radiovictrix]
MPLFRVTTAVVLGALLGAALAQDLTVYSGRSEDFIAPLVERFEAETGLQVDVRYGNTAELAATLLEEGANSPADVFFPQDGGALGAVAREGLFAELPGELLERVDARFRSPEGLWVGVTGRARVLAYNTDSVSEDELPASVFELTEPQWQGRVGWAPTNASFQAFVTAMRLLEGEARTREWLEGMLANGVRAYEGNTPILEALGRGEIDAGITNHYYLYRFLEEQGESFPVRNHLFEGGDVGSLINVAGVGVLASSDQRENAEAFVAYLLEDDAQTYFTETVFEYPLVPGIPTNELLVPLEEIETPEIDLSNLDDLEATLELLEEVGAL